MFRVQRRKSENSSWHSVKFSKGKAEAETIELIKPILESCKKEYPDKQHRVIDTETNKEVEV